MHRSQVLAIAAGLAFALQAQASLFEITFTSNDGLTTGGGQLVGTPNGDGTYTAQAGSFFDIFTDVTLPDVPVGRYDIIPNPNPPSAQYSPLGVFIFDNQVLKGQNPFITNPGLLFSNGAGEELNLYSNGSSAPVPNGTYILMQWQGAYSYVYGDTTLTCVPEPSTCLAGALLVLPFGLGALRSLRKHATV